MYHTIRGAVRMIVGCVHAYTSLGQRLKHIPKERFRKLSFAFLCCTCLPPPWQDFHDFVRIFVRTVLVIELVSVRSMSWDRGRRSNVAPTQALLDMLSIGRSCSFPDCIGLITLQRLSSHLPVNPVVPVQVTYRARDHLFNNDAVSNQVDGGIDIAPEVYYSFGTRCHDSIWRGYRSPVACSNTSLEVARTGGRICRCRRR
jgi:hypothetical protein